MGHSSQWSHRSISTLVMVKSGYAGDGRNTAVDRVSAGVGLRWVEFASTSMSRQS